MIDTNSQNEEEIDFNGETTSSIVSEIIKKNSLKDIDEEAIEKLEKGEPFISPGAIITDTAKKISLGKTSKEEATLLLEKSLRIPKKTAEELTKDITIKLLPIIQNILKREMGATRPGVINVKNTVPSINENLSREDDGTIIKKPFAQEKNQDKRIEKTFPKQKNEFIKKEPSKVRAKEDSYREPIE